MAEMLRTANAQRNGGGKETPPPVFSHRRNQQSEQSDAGRAGLRDQITKASLAAIIHPVPGEQKSLDLTHPCFESADTECDICHGMKHVFVPGKGWTRCRCFASAHFHDMLGSAQWPLPYKMAKAVPDDFVIRSDSAAKLGDFIKSAAEDISNLEQNTLLHVPGCVYARETALALLTKLYAYENAGKVNTTGFARLSDAVVPYYTPAEQLDENTGSFKSLCDTDVLAFMFGDENTNNGHKTVLYEMLYTRMLTGKMTIAATVLSMAEILSVYGRNTSDLLADFNNLTF